MWSMRKDFHITGLNGIYVAWWLRPRTLSSYHGPLSTALLLRRHYIPMRTFAPLVDLSQWVLFFDHFFRFFNFASNNVCLYTVPPFLFGLPLIRLLWGLLLNTCLTFLLLSILLSWPIQINRIFWHMKLYLNLHRAVLIISESPQSCINYIWISTELH